MSDTVHDQGRRAASWRAGAPVAPCPYRELTSFFLDGYTAYFLRVLQHESISRTHNPAKMARTSVSPERHVGSDARYRDRREDRAYSDRRRRVEDDRRSTYDNDRRRTDYDRDDYSRRRDRVRGDERGPSGRNSSERDRSHDRQRGGGGYKERERDRERDARPGPSRRSASPRGRSSKDRSRSASKPADSAEDKAKPNFNPSGLLAAATKTVKHGDGTSTVLKYHEPPEARKPPVGWRLYVFKGKEQVGEYNV